MGLTKSRRRAFIGGYDLGLGLTKIENNSNSLIYFAKNKNVEIYKTWGGGDINLFSSTWSGTSKK
jgi:hypothetical protein